MSCLSFLLSIACLAQQNDENPLSTTPTKQPTTTELALNIENLARNRPEEALQLAEEALTIFANSPNPVAHGRVLNGAAYALYFLGRYDQSMQRAKEAESLAQAHQLSDVLARSHMLQGNVLQLIGEYTRALKQYREAANYYQSVGNLQYLGYCYNNMGNTYRAAGRYEAALDLYQQYQKISNSPSVNKGIGETYLNLGEIQQALDYFRDAYSLYEEDNDQLGMALAINSQANAYIIDEQPDKALRLFERAIHLAQQNSQQYSLEYSYRGKAKALLKLGKLDDAMSWVMRAYDMASERRETSALIANLEIKSEIYQAQDDIYQALQAYQHVRKLEQAYKAERDSTQLAVMQALFESESKAAEIAALEKRNTLLSLEKEIEKEQTQYARLASGVLIAALLLLMIWAWNIYRDKRRLAHLYAELGHAKIQAEQAAKTKSVFLANMSHEIRTPLTSIIGYADGILQGDVDKDAQQRVIQIISENGNHLLHVINDILDFTKIEANKLEFEALTTPLFPLLAQLESVTGKRARDKGLNFDINYHFPLPEQIISDPTRLRQILFNLTSNALKFTQTGSIIVDVTAQEEQLKISVKDTGIGINQEQQQRLFTPFNQADGSINRRFGGSGLGLSISQALAQGLGGEIDVLSQEGIGSKFTLVLPLNEAPDCRWIGSYDKISLTTTQKSAETSQPRHFGNARVLLAEDHPNNRDLICLLLKKMGIEVVAVEDGKQACDKAIHQCFDLILMDIQMPVMDGLQALKQIRSFDHQTPIIALTANSMKHEIEHYMAAGFNDHLPKPIPRDTLVELLSDYLTTDKESVDKTPEGNDEMVSMIRDYIVILKEHLQDARRAWENQNSDELQEIAHKIKGSAGAFGFAKLGVQFDKIAQLIKSGQLEQLPEQVQEVLAQSDVYLNVPGADIAMGLRNHNMDIEEYHQELLAFSQHNATVLLKLRTAVQNDAMLAVPLLQRLILQLQRLALPKVELLSQQLKARLEKDATPDQCAEILAELEQQLDNITQFYTRPDN